MSRKNVFKIALIPSVLVLIIVGTFFIVYPTGFNGVDAKKAIGRAEQFAEGIEKPQGMVVDKDGRLFVQSARNGDVYLVYKDGDIADFAYIDKYYGYGMDLDENDNFIIASRHRVAVVSSSGKLLRLIDGFMNAYDVARGPDNLIFVSDAEANIIYCISPDNQVSVFKKLTGEKSGTVPNIAGISFDKDYQNLYGVNMYRGELYKIELSETNIAMNINVIASKLQKPNFIDMDEQGNAYITCIGDNSVVRVNKNSIKELIDIKGELPNPSGVSVMSGSEYHTVYVGSRDANKVYKINIDVK